MLYLLKVEKLASKDLIYHIFETHTDSVIEANDKLVVELLSKYKMEAKNIYLKEDKIQIKDWPHKIEQYSKSQKTYYVLLGKASDDIFKLIRSTGFIEYLNQDYLKELIEIGSVANCDYVDGGERIYRSIDTRDMRTDPKFFSYISSKYKEFTAKVALLGLDIRFSYTIENEEVKITKYIGTSNKVILPSFVTAICYRAFAAKGLLEEVKLNEGLKYIGNMAMSGCRIESIILPHSLEFVGQSAFRFNGHTDPNKKIYKKLNPNTIILN